MALLFFLLCIEYELFTIQQKSTLQVIKLLLKDILLAQYAGLSVVCEVVFFSIFCPELIWKPNCNLKQQQQQKTQKNIIPRFLDGYYQIIYCLTSLLAFQDALFDLQSQKATVLNCAASFVRSYCHMPAGIVSHGIPKRKYFDTSFCYPTL